MGPGHFSKISNFQNKIVRIFTMSSQQVKRPRDVPSRKMRYANGFFYGLDGEIRPKLTFFGTPQPVHRGPLLLSTRGGGIGGSTQYNFHMSPYRDIP